MTVNRDSERRKQRLLERARTQNFVCICCGCTDWCTAEGHHIAGRLYDKHVEFFCANCHRRLTEAQKSHPHPSSRKPGPVECAGHYSLGLADVLHPTSRLATSFGHQLLEGGLNDEATRSLTLRAGHFLIALGPILEEVAPHLEDHGRRLCDASVQAPGYATSPSIGRQPKNGAKFRRRT
jgi:hypothetical protein